MALSAATGFRLRKSLSGIEVGANLFGRIANSTTLKIGDFVRANTAGFIVRVGVGSPILGVCSGFRVTNRADNEGVNPFALGAPTAGATLTEDDQIATASDNQTRVEFAVAEITVDVGGHLLWYNDADADQARTNDYQFFDVNAAGNQVTQSTASDANGQVQLISRDPDGDADLSKGLYRIVEHQLGGDIDSATAKNAA